MVLGIKFALDAVSSFATSVQAAQIFWTIFLAAAAIGLVLLFRRPRKRVTPKGTPLLIVPHAAERLRVVRDDLLVRPTEDGEQRPIRAQRP